MPCRGYFIIGTLILATLAEPVHAQTPYDDLVKTAIQKQDKGDDKEAIQLCNPTYEAAIYNRANAKKALKQYEAAIADYDKSIELSPDDIDAWFSRGNLKDDLGRYTEAIADFDKCIRLDPNNAKAYTYRGISKKNLKLYAEAIVDYDKAIQLDPKYAGAYYSRGAAKRKLQRYEEAIADYDKAIQLDPGNAVNWFSRGNAKDDLNRYEDALVDFDRSIQLDPDYSDAWFNRAIVKAELRRYPEAILDYDKYIGIHPDDKDAYNNRGRAKIELKRFTDALADLDRAIQLDPDLRAAYNNRGYVYFNLGDYDKAIADYDKAKQIGGPSYSPRYSYRDEAVAALQKQNSASPATTTSSYFINTGWLSPLDDVNTGPYNVTGSNKVTIHLRTISNVPLSGNNFRLLVNGISGSRATLADLHESSRGNREFAYDYRATLEVTKGLSHVQLVASVDNYTKSSPEMVINYSPEQINLYILAIGVPSDLRYSEKDATDFASLFSGQMGEGKLFRQAEIQTLTGAQANADNIATKLISLARKDLTRNDVIMVFISSHGFLLDGKLRLPGSDFNSLLQERTSVGFDREILQPLSQLDCKKFLFLDACHSGQAAEGVKSPSNLEVNDAIKDLIDAYNGISIIASSTGDQKSWEDDEWQNGAFTKALREGLEQGLADKNNNGIIRVEELAEYVKARVKQLVQNKKHQLQTPVWKNLIGDVGIYIK